MTVATLSSKGQITLPAATRRQLKLQAGDRIVVDTREGEIVLRLAPDLLAWRGSLGKAKPREAERKAARWAATREATKETAR